MRHFCDARSRGVYVMDVVGLRKSKGGDQASSAHVEGDAEASTACCSDPNVGPAANAKPARRPSNRLARHRNLMAGMMRPIAFQFQPVF